jgi:NAD(P)-dependent dehydrogenase (short-subunit alcohol dehydrogenase family)
LAGRVFAVIEDPLGIARELAQRLSGVGATLQLMDRHGELGPADGLVHLGLVAAAQPKTDAGVRALALADLARRALGSGAKWLVAALPKGGAFGAGAAGSDAVSLDGAAGLLKSVAREWPEGRVCCVHLDPSDDPARLADHLLAEILARDDRIEVAYADGVRHSVVPVRAALDCHTGPSGFGLTPDSVVLLTGGARGITARVARALAAEWAPRLILVGRTAEPVPEEDPLFSGLDDPAALRGRIIATGAVTEPAEVERTLRRLLAERQMRATFEGLRSTGAAFEYRAVDVRDAEAFGGLIDDLYDRYGRIDAAIHGAGVVEDKLLRHKSAESFRRVFDTKIQGALTLARHLRDDVRMVVLFSSIAGAFGSRGQADYAAANDALDQLAHTWNARIPGRVVSIAWGPWAGGGMVGPELEREYLRRGVGLIDPEHGVRSLLGELAFGSGAHVILMRGDPDSLG